jgi:nucleoside-diphosphate-sugar epimerase
MISQDIRQENASSAVWLDESLGPLAPRNIYGVTKLAAEGLCRLHFLEFGLKCVVLRTGRFFPEEDDTQRELSGPNLKANEFLNRRLTVEDAADAHVVALDRAPALGFEIFVLSAPTPFVRSEAEELKRAAANVIVRYFPDAPALYARRGWQLPTSIGRVYDASRIERVMGFRCATDFGRVLHALRTDGWLPYAHEPAYQSPKESPAVS